MSKKAGNRNKKCRLRGEDRRRHFERHGRPKPTVKVVHRNELGSMEDSVVKASGELVMIPKGKVNIPLLLVNVVIGGEYVDHVWVSFSKEDWCKLKLARKSNRVYMIGEVYMYIGNSSRHEKYGLRNVKLVSEY